MNIWELSDLATPWAVHVVVTLGVPDRLADGPMPADTLARQCGADADALSRVLRQLVQKGVFVETEPNCFGLNENARDLIGEGARLGLDLDGFGGRMARAWSTLLTAVRTGRPAYHEVFGRPYWEDLEANPKIAGQFDDLMGPGHGTPDPEVLLDPGAWPSVRTVVDVGGGTGWLLAEVLRARPHARGILVDLPRAVARSAETFHNAGVADRATAVAQSFFDPLPAGADLYLLKNTLANWPDDGALALLKRIAEAARPNGRLVVLGGVTAEERPSPELLMLVLVGGRSRTLDEFRKIAREAGLKVTASGKQPSGRFIVECGTI